MDSLAALVHCFVPTNNSSLLSLSCRILSADIPQINPADAASIALKLVEGNPPHEARISAIVNKLSALSLKNLPAILSFFLALSKSKNTNWIKPPVSQFSSNPASQHSVLSRSANQNSISDANQNSSSEKTQLQVASVFNPYYSPKSPIDIPSEIDLVRDILFVAQGVDGAFIKFNSSINYFVTNAEISLPAPTRSIISRLCELGFLYKSISTKISSLSTSTSIGLYEQAFFATIQKHLVNYYKTIASLENLVDIHQKSDSFSTSGLSLKRLYVWFQPPLANLRIITTLFDTCKDVKGGALISIIHNYTLHGDPSVHAFISSLLIDISRPFYRSLSNWIRYGDLQDPFAEFFVTANSSQDPSTTNVWKSKYILNYTMVPSFISKSLAKKIFLIGKSINFIRNICNDREPMAIGWTTTKSSLSTPSSFESSSFSKDLQYGDLKSLEFSIDHAYQLSSHHLLTILIDHHNLLLHLTALNRYLLLGQGDFAQTLMDLVAPSLSNPATSLYRHNLTGILETAVRSSNAQYDDPDVLRRLDVRLLDPSSSTQFSFTTSAGMSSHVLGWSTFSLDYHIDIPSTTIMSSSLNPITTILSPIVMQSYHKLFMFLWHVKRVEHELNDAWKRGMTMPHSIRYHPAYSKLIHCAMTLHAELRHFIHQFQHYMYFEVIETKWSVLHNVIVNRKGDLDMVIGEVNSFLNGVGMGCCLMNQSTNTVSGDKQTVNMSAILFSIFDTILVFTGTQESVIRSAMESSNSDSLSDSNVARLRRMVDESCEQYRDQLKTFLTCLNGHDDSSLRILGTRLNYNGIYSDSF